MTNERSFALVFGYLPDIDKVCEHAQKSGLHQRFAVALDSYRTGHAEMYFDRELLYRVLQVVGDLTDHDTIRIDYDEDPFRFVAAGDLTPGDIVFGDDPFDALFFLSGDTAICMVQLFPYTAIGGPFPYHDTHCFSFYFAHIDENVVLSRMEALAATDHLLIRDVLHGGVKPHVSFLTKLKRLL